MIRAARAVADWADAELAASFIDEGDPRPDCCALVGGGDNGGDALHAAAMLAEAGRSVRAAILSEHPHVRGLQAAEAAGVEIVYPAAEHWGFPDGWAVGRVWLDGLTGTGLSGPVREPLATAIGALDALAAERGTTVVSIDVPSGVHADDGSLEGPVLRGTHCVTMGAPKSCLLLPPAAHAVPSFEVVDLGVELPGDACRPGSGSVWRLEAEDVADAIRVPGATDHKYTRGVVGLSAGSDTYPGAGVLASAGALGTGPGMVRVETASRPTLLVLVAHPGVVTAGGRVQAVLVGSGLDQDMEGRARTIAMRSMTRGVPLVLDAGARGFVPDMLERFGKLDNVILTPHAGEAVSLLSDLHLADWTREHVEAMPLQAASLIAGHTGATVALKGATTVVVDAVGTVYSQSSGSGWTGVAGSGDVLAGMIVGLLAQRAADSERGGPTLDIPRTVASAVALHGWAADRAAHGGDGAWTRGRPIQAEDIAESISPLIGDLLAD